MAVHAPSVQPGRAASSSRPRGEKTGEQPCRLSCDPRHRHRHGTRARFGSRPFRQPFHEETRTLRPGETGGIGQAAADSQLDQRCLQQDCKTAATPGTSSGSRNRLPAAGFPEWRRRRGRRGDEKLPSEGRNAEAIRSGSSSRTPAIRPSGGQFRARGRNPAAKFTSPAGRGPRPASGFCVRRPHPATNPRTRGGPPARQRAGQRAQHRLRVLVPGHHGDATDLPRLPARVRQRRGAGARGIVGGEGAPPGRASPDPALARIRLLHVGGIANSTSAARTPASRPALEPRLERIPAAARRRLYPQFTGNCPPASPPAATVRRHAAGSEIDVRPAPLCQGGKPGASPDRSEQPAAGGGRADPVHAAAEAVQPGQVRAARSRPGTGQRRAVERSASGVLPLLAAAEFVWPAH